MPISRKYCSKCHAMKAIEDFGLNKSGNRYMTCAPCRKKERERRAGYRERHPEVKTTYYGRCSMCGRARLKGAWTCARDECKSSLLLIQKFATMAPPVCDLE